MPTYKTTWIFNQSRYGWTESWYFDQPNPEYALEIAKKLAIKRTDLLANNVLLEYIRISDIDVLSDSLVFGIQKWGTRDQPRGDTPWNAIYCRVEAGSAYRRQMWLRGIPDDWIQLEASNPADNPIDPTLQAAFNAFRSALTNNAFKLKVISKDIGDVTERPVTALGQNGSGQIVFSAVGLTSQPGDEFRSKKWSGPDKKQLNGVFKVVTNTGAAVTIAKKYTDLTAPDEDSGGKLVARIVKYKDITDAKIMRVAKRNTGRAFFVQAGRRKRVK